MALFNNELAWVTGGSRGIGESIVESLSSTSLTVRSISSIDVDFASPSNLDKWLISQKEYPGVLVLNAGINEPQDFLQQNQDTLTKIFQVNFMANQQILRSVLPYMQEAKFGHIIFVSSLYSARARIGRSAYSTSKSALDALMRSIAIEFTRYGILANSVAPGFVDTELTRKNNSSEEIQNIESQIPIGRLAKKNEISNFVSFLATQNSYISGQTIQIDGGYSIR